MESRILLLDVHFNWIPSAVPEKNGFDRRTDNNDTPFFSPFMRYGISKNSFNVFINSKTSQKSTLQKCLQTQFNNT